MSTPSLAIEKSKPNGKTHVHPVGQQQPPPPSLFSPQPPKVFQIPKDQILPCAHVPANSGPLQLQWEPFEAQFKAHNSDAVQYQYGVAALPIPNLEQHLTFLAETQIRDVVILLIATNATPQALFSALCQVQHFLFKGVPVLVSLHPSQKVVDTMHGIHQDSAIRRLACSSIRVLVYIYGHGYQSNGESNVRFANKVDISISKVAAACARPLDQSATHGPNFLATSGCRGAWDQVPAIPFPSHGIIVLAVECGTGDRTNVEAAANRLRELAFFDFLLRIQFRSTSSQTVRVLYSSCESKGDQLLDGAAEFFIPAQLSISALVLSGKGLRYYRNKDNLMIHAEGCSHQRLRTVFPSLFDDHGCFVPEVLAANSPIIFANCAESCFKKQLSSARADHY